MKVVTRVEKLEDMYSDIMDEITHLEESLTEVQEHLNKLISRISKKESN